MSLIRRRMLMAASQTSGGGGKIRNVIRAKWGDKPAFGRFYHLVFTAEYPVSSRIYIGLSNGNQTFIDSGETHGEAAGLKDSFTAIGLSFVSSQSYEPQIEDDTYIYELE